MSSYSIRNETRLDTIKVALEVAQMGVDHGLWTITRPCSPEAHNGYQQVTDKAGRVFAIRVVICWGHEGKVTMGVAWIQEGTFSAGGGDSFEASVTASRGAAVVLRELKRRVLDNPEAQQQADKFRADIEAQKDANGSLLALVERVKAMGVPLRDPKAGETHEASGCLPGSHSRIRVNVRGEATIDALSIPVDKLPALLALLRAQ